LLNLDLTRCFVNGSLWTDAPIVIYCIKAVQTR
jgi:hypothetical protein